MPEETTAAEVAVITGDAVEAPRGFVTYAANAGIKDESLDLSIVASHTPCVADGVFTQSRFAGPSVALSRRQPPEWSAQGHRHRVQERQRGHRRPGRTGRRRAR